MPRKYGRAKHQGINFVIGELRKIVKDPKSTIAQRLRALDRLSVIDDILEIDLSEPGDITRKPDVDPEVNVDDEVERMLARLHAKAKKAAREEEKNGVSTSSEGSS